MNQQLLTSKKLSPETIALLQRWVNLHRVLWILMLACFFAAWNRGLALLYGPFSLLLALIVISHLLPRLQLREIRLQRSFPGILTAGEEATIGYQIQLKNARYHIEIEDRLPFLAPGTKVNLFFAQIDNHIRSQRRVLCEHRGCFHPKNLGMISAYPFGIVRYSVEIPTPPSEVLVFPRVVELSAIPLPNMADSTTVGEVLAPQQGGRDEFAAVREYALGDEISRIHWAASARHQQLVVKEYEHANRPALMLVLDCRPAFNLGEGARSTFEYAITIAASMIRFATREGIQCFFVAESEEPSAQRGRESSTQRGKESSTQKSRDWREMLIPAYSNDLHDLYELLARLNPTGELSGASLVEVALNRYPQANIVASFRLDSEDQLPQLPPHVTHVDLMIHQRSFTHPIQVSRPSYAARNQGNRMTYSIQANMQLENLFR